ncbi:unnamed protein product [Prunus armeniaca]|nr:unnamed protein product [Prunus armeniaca]
MPHLLIFSIKGLGKWRAKGNEKPTLMDLPNDFLFDVFARLPQAVDAYWSILSEKKF